VEVAGVDAVASPLAARGNIGVTLADERAWYWRLTGRANLEFFAALHGLRRRDAADRTGELLDVVGLVPDADRPFGEYSSGMRLRLSLARALLGDPKLLLLDEPTRSIDPPGAEQFRAMIAGYVSRTGASALIASHDLEEVETLAARAFVLSAGERPELLDGPLSRHRLQSAFGMAHS
jgi:ABC-2 type transport system ATP-binding protein